MGNLYIIITMICIMIFILIIIEIFKRIRVIFTKREVEKILILLYKKDFFCLDSINVVLLLILPVINITFIIIILCNYNYIERTVINYYLKNIRQ